MKRILIILYVLLLCSSIFLSAVPASVSAPDSPYLTFVRSEVGWNTGYTIYELHYPEASKTTEATFTDALTSLDVAALTEAKGRFNDLTIEWLFEDMPYFASVDVYGVINDSITLTVESEKDITGSKEECTIGNCSDKLKFDVLVKDQIEGDEMHYVIGCYDRKAEKDQVTYFYHSYGVVGSHPEVRYKDVWATLKDYSISNSKAAPATSHVDDFKTAAFTNAKTDNVILIRFKGTYTGQVNADGSYEISLDHVPQLESKDYAEFAWWNASWPYRKCLNITGSVGADTYYQVKLLEGQNDSVTGENFSLDDYGQTDFDDIRFTDNDETTLLPYWLESVASGVATVWVNVSDNLNTSAEIFIYYGNPAADSASDGDATFLFFDDFSGVALDGDKWQGDTGSTTVADSIMTLTGGAGVWKQLWSKTEYTTNTIRARVQFSTPDYSYGSMFGMRDFATDDWCLNWYVGGQNYIRTSKGGAGTAVNSNNDVVMNTYDILGQVAQADFLKNGVAMTNSPITTNIPIVPISFYFGSNGGSSYKIMSDWVLIRKYISPEPAFSHVCGEEEYCTPTPTNLANTSGNFYVNYTWEDGDQGDCYCVPDSYNISWSNATDSGWQNGTTDYYFNWTTDPHGCVNVTIYAYSPACDLLSTPISDNVCMSNNPITIENCTNPTVNLGETVYLDFDYSDADEDAGTFATNFTKGTLNSTTGEFTWITDEWDTFNAYFNVSDGYGSVDECWVTITVETAGFLIADPYNNITNNDSLSFYVDVSIPVFFSINSTSKLVDAWYWSLNDMSFPNNVSNFTASGFSEGVYFLAVYAVNTTYGPSNTITWTVLVGEKGLTYLMTLQLVEEQEMLGHVYLFIFLLFLAIVFMFTAFLSPNMTLKIFAGALSGLLFFVEGRGLIGGVFGEELEMAWLSTLLTALGFVMAIFTILSVISMLYMMFKEKGRAGMTGLPYDPDADNW